jgi:hypothetical protein
MPHLPNTIHQPLYQSSLTGPPSKPADTEPHTQSRHAETSVSETSSLSLQDVFVSHFLKPKQPTTDVAAKRRKLHHSSAVITNEEYVVAVKEVTTKATPKRSGDVKKRKVVLVEPLSPESSLSSSSSIPKLPPPLPKLPMSSSEDDCDQPCSSAGRKKNVKRISVLTAQRRAPSSSMLNGEDVTSSSEEDRYSVYQQPTSTVNRSGRKVSLPQRYRNMV